MPFRLTRDIEDALGVAGVEGVLRSSAEHTMRVLRAHSDALITILQVFVRNPLYKWALDTTPYSTAAAPTQPPSAAARVPAEADAVAEQHGERRGGGRVINREAERALLRIQDKLAGRLAGVSAGTNEALAVEGQVRALLDEARDPENLSRMFDGWAAWL